MSGKRTSTRTGNKNQANTQLQFPFQCDLCQSGFFDQFGFFEHLKTHYDSSSSSTSNSGTTSAPKKTTSPTKPVTPLPMRTRKSGNVKTELEAPGAHNCFKCGKTFLAEDWLTDHVKKCKKKKAIALAIAIKSEGEESHMEVKVQRRKSARTPKKSAKMASLEELPSETEDQDDEEYILPTSLFPDEDEPSFQAEEEAEEEEEDQEEEEDVEHEQMCPTCGEMLPSQNQLNLHTLQEHKDVEIDGHLCAVCGKKFPTSRKRTLHGKKVHPGKTVKPTGPRLKRDRSKKGSYPCKECNRIFLHRNSLSYHLKNHEGVRNHVCETCNKAFFSSSALKVHERIHTGQKPYACEQCGKTFRQWGDLKYHIASIHTEIRNFKCEFCNKEFARKYSLTIHRRIHTKERNYRCEFCSKAFRASSYLQSHIRIHTGVKPYECSICQKPFRVKSDMTRHLSSHSRTEEVTITDEQGVTTTVTRPKQRKSNRKPKPKVTKPKPVVHNLVAVDESGQIIPLAPTAAKSLRAGQVIQVPASSSPSKRITLRSSKKALKKKPQNIPAPDPDNLKVQESPIVFDADEEEEEDESAQNSGGAMYVWPTFIS